MIKPLKITYKQIKYVLNRYAIELKHLNVEIIKIEVAIIVSLGCKFP